MTTFLQHLFCLPIRRSEQKEKRIATGKFNRLGFSSTNASTQESKTQRDREILEIAHHDSRTYLHNLNLQLGVIEEILRRQDPQQDEFLFEMLELGKQQIRHLERLSDRMLCMEKTGREFKLRLEKFYVRDLVEEVISHFQIDAHRNGCSISLTASANPLVRWDRAAIQQILVNLLSNAIKHGGGKPISLSIQEKWGVVKFSVIDRGPGIKSEEQDRIFQKFQRGSVSTNKGLGLGLFIVKKNAKAHLGKVKLRSAAGQGAEFSVLLPKFLPLNK